MGSLCFGNAMMRMVPVAAVVGEEAVGIVVAGRGEGAAAAGKDGMMGQRAKEALMLDPEEISPRQRCMTEYSMR